MNKCHYAQSSDHNAKVGRQPLPLYRICIVFGTEFYANDCCDQVDQSEEFAKEEVWRQKLT
jgi:hypothetical protein